MPASARQRPRSLADQLLAEVGPHEISVEERAAAAEASFHPVPRALLIPIERIAPSRDNPRKSFDDLDDLATSIAERGVLQPLVVRQDAEHPGYFLTVVGARRLLAAQIVRGSRDDTARSRVAELPCIVTDEIDRDAFADALLENLARKDLSRAEVMAALLRLQTEFSWSARYIARRTGRSVSDVAELLRVAKDDEVAESVRAEVLTPSAAGQIQRLPEPVRRIVLDEVRQGKARTVEELRQLRRRLADPPGPDLRPRSDAPTAGTPPIPELRPANSSPPVTGEGGGVSEFGHPASSNADTGDLLTPARVEHRSREEVSEFGHLPPISDPTAATAGAQYAALHHAACDVTRAIGVLVRQAGTLDAVDLAAVRQGTRDLARYLEQQAS